MTWPDRNVRSRVGPSSQDFHPAKLFEQATSVTVGEGFGGAHQAIVRSRLRLTLNQL
jgi:hypothetical protein